MTPPRCVVTVPAVKMLSDLAHLPLSYSEPRALARAVLIIVIDWNYVTFICHMYRQTETEDALKETFISGT